MATSLSSFTGGSKLAAGSDPMSLSSYSKGANQASSGGGGGIVGGLLSHMPKLGVSNLVHQIGGIPYGLAALATGKGGYKNVWSAAGKGLASSLFGTIESIPGVALVDKPFNDAFAASFGDQYRPEPVWQKAAKEGILPAALETLGNVSLAGGAAAKLATVGDVGKLAAASEAADAATRAGFTAEDVANASSKLSEAGGSIKDAEIGNKLLRTAAKASLKADGLTADDAAVASRARLLHTAELAAHPYQTIFKAGRAYTAAAQADQLAGDAGTAATEAAPITDEAARAAASEGLHGIAESAPDAALNRTRALLRNAVAEPGAPLTADEQIAKLTEMLPKAEEAPAAAATAGAPAVGPLEDAVRHAATTAITPRAASVVERLPEPVRNLLSTVEGHIQAHQTKNVVFERMRTQLADRNKIMASEPVQAGLDVARRYLVGQTLEDGTKIGPDLADRLLGDETMARLSGVKNLEEEAATAAPEARDLIHETLVKAGDRSAESIPAEIAANPDFEQAMQHLTESWAGAAGERLERLTGSRLGTQGLEQAGSDVPKMTGAQQSEMAAIRKLRERLTTLGKGEERQRTQVEKLIARHEATSEKLGEQIKRAVQGHQEAAPATFEQARGAEVTPGRSLAQEAQRALPGAEDMRAHEVYRRGVVSGRQIEKAKQFGESADDLIRRKAVLDKQVADLKRSIIGYKLPGQVARLRAEGALERRVGRLGDALDDPSLVRTPPEWQPIYGALKDLHDAALTNPALAKAVEGLPEKFSTVLDLAAQRGFDPAHIRSFEPGQVRRLVYGQVTLGKSGIELGKTIEAGTRKARLTGQAKTRSLSALAGAMAEATHEDNTNALATFIEDTWAKSVPEDGVVPKGFVPWDAAKRHLLTGESTSAGVEVRGATATKMIPVQVKSVLDSFSKDYNHPVFKAIRTVTNPWKALVLTLNPGWYVNHFIGHVVGALKEGTNLTDWANAWREYRRGGASLGSNRVVGAAGRGEHAFEGVSGVENQSIVSDLDQPQMIQYPHGAAGLKLARETGGNKSAVRLFMQRYRAPIKTIDDISRAAVFNAAKRGGASDAEALQHATEAFLDYQRMGPFESQVVNSVVPFYSFQKAMMRVVAKMPLDHPVATGFLMTLSDLNQKMNERIYGTDLPSYYENLVKLPGFGTVNIGKFNPFEHAAGALTSPQAIAGSINPFISALVRNAYGAPDYFPHNAQGQLVAPATRLNEFGVEVPATSLPADVGAAFGGVPLGRLLGSATQSSTITGQAPTARGVGVAKFAGVPEMTPEQIGKLVKRVMQFRAAQAATHA